MNKCILIVCGLAVAFGTQDALGRRHRSKTRSHKGFKREEEVLPFEDQDFEIEPKEDHTSEPGLNPEDVYM